MNKKKSPNKGIIYSCKICGRPNPDVYMKVYKSEPPFEEYLRWTKEMVIEHIKKEHKDVLK